MNATTNDIWPELTRRIIHCAVEVHRALGPGRFERTYRTCLVRKLELNGMAAKEEVPIPITYKGVAPGEPCRADLVVDATALIELKAIDNLLPIHATQVLTYLKLSRLPVGLLINFNVVRLTSGVRRFILPRLNRSP